MRILLVFWFSWVLAAGQPTPHIRAAERVFQRAETARKVQDWRTAEKLYLQAIDIEPTFMEAYRGLLQVYLENKQPTEGGAILARILQIEPDSTKERLLLGKLLMDAGQPMRALAQFAAAVKEAPNNPDALYGFARAALLSGMSDRALRAAKHGAAEFPKDRRFTKMVEELRAAGEGRGR